MLILLKCIPIWTYKLATALCRKAPIPNTDYDRSRTTGDCSMFPLFGMSDDARCTRDIESVIAMAEAAFNKTKTLSFSNWT